MSGDRAKNLDEAVAAGAEYLQRMFWRASLTDGDYKTAANAFLEAIGYEGLLAERDETQEAGQNAAQMRDDLYDEKGVLEARIEVLESLLREASSWMGGMSTKSQTAEEELRDWLARYRVLVGEEA